MSLEISIEMTMTMASDGEPSHQCWLCAEPSKTPCQDCDRVYFCRPEHLELHRQQGVCRPFSVRRSEGVGRMMVATRDIQPLETILEERPLVTGPCRDGSLVCVECLVSIKSTVTSSYLLIQRGWTYLQRCFIQYFNTRCRFNLINNVYFS